MDWGPGHSSKPDGLPCGVATNQQERKNNRKTDADNLALQQPAPRINEHWKQAYENDSYWARRQESNKRRKERAASMPKRPRFKKKSKKSNAGKRKAVAAVDVPPDSPASEWDVFPDCDIPLSEHGSESRAQTPPTPEGEFSYEKGFGPDDMTGVEFSYEQGVIDFDDIPLTPSTPGKDDASELGADDMTDV